MSNGCVTTQRGLRLAALCLVALSGCAGLSDSPTGTVERNRGNATVRAAVYVEAAANVAAPAPVGSPAVSGATKTNAAPRKQDKRAAQSTNRKDNKRSAVAAVPGKQVAPASVTSGLSIDQKVPVSATGYRYTYSVELDTGGTRTFGFATDQGLLVGDRVMVSDTGVTPIPR